MMLFFHDLAQIILPVQSLPAFIFADFQQKLKDGHRLVIRRGLNLPRQCLVRGSSFQIYYLRLKNLKNSSRSVKGVQSQNACDAARCSGSSFPKRCPGNFVAVRTKPCAIQRRNNAHR